MRTPLDLLSPQDHECELEPKHCGDTIKLCPHDSLMFLHTSCPVLPYSNLECSAPAQVSSVYEARPVTACWMVKAGSS